MAALVNRLSWSNTRAASLSKCLREFYWRAYGSWGGWDRASAAPEARQAYVFNKMKNLPMLVGELVHHVIEQVFDAHRRGRPILALEQSQANIRNRLRQAWRESREKRWEQSPKNFHNLAEHFYGPEPDRETCERWRDDAFRILENFYELDLTRRILASPSEEIRTVEKLEEFVLDDKLLFIKIDLAWHDGKKLHLIDWKTGGSDDGVEEQLAGYALFAACKWDVPVEQMLGYPVYLREKTVGENCLAPEKIGRLQASIRRYFVDVAANLTDPARNLADISDFPMTTELWKCKSCFYRQLCRR